MELIQNNFVGFEKPGGLNASQGYLGAVQLLEKVGFSPSSEKSPLAATLNEIFDRFIQSTGIDDDQSAFRREFLAENPATGRAISLYDALGNTFSNRGAGDQAAIVDYLNRKIDTFIARQDQNKDNILSFEESGLEESQFQVIDENRDDQINGDEFRKEFFGNFQQLKEVLQYFNKTPGVLINLYA